MAESALRSNRRPIGSRRPWYDYIQVKVAEGDWRYEHRVVMNAGAHQVVHHKNGDGWDNRPENLELMNPVRHLNGHRWPEPAAGWSYRYDACQQCERQDRPHKAGGLCQACYQLKRYRKVPR